MYADAIPGMNPYVPLSRNVSAKSSPLSTNASVMSLRSASSAARRGTAATAARTRYAVRRPIGALAYGAVRAAVASCHVERLLDDDVWARFRRLLDDPPGGFRVAALVRPPDSEHGEEGSSGSSAPVRSRSRSGCTPTGPRPRTLGPPAAIRRRASAATSRGFASTASSRASSPAAAGTPTTRFAQWWRTRGWST